MKKLLLTGATGFLGSHLLKALINKTEYEIIVLKRSFSNLFRIEELSTNARIKFYDIDKIELESIFQENEIDTILHCATNYGRNNEDVLNIVNSNLILPLTILQLAAKYKVSTFINTDTIIDKKISHYSLSKNQFSDWLNMYSSKIKCINLSLEHFYGANDNNTKFTTYIIKSFLDKVESINLTEGEQKRYFIYIDDVVKAFLTILENLENLKENFYTFDVSTETNISIKEFILLVKELTNNISTKLNFGAIPYRENEIMEFKTDITKLMELGWSPKIELKEGLIKTITEEIKK